MLLFSLLFFSLSSSLLFLWFSPSFLLFSVSVFVFVVIVIVLVLVVLFITDVLFVFKFIVVLDFFGVFTISVAIAVVDTFCCC